jgi:hypothetical protein
MSLKTKSRDSSMPKEWITSIELLNTWAYDIFFLPIKEFDLDGSGTLSKLEFEKFISKIGIFVSKQVTDSFILIRKLELSLMHLISIKTDRSTIKSSSMPSE